MKIYFKNQQNYLFPTVVKTIDANVSIVARKTCLFVPASFLEINLADIQACPSSSCFVRETAGRIHFEWGH